MQPTLNLNLPEPEWITLLRHEQAKGKSISQIARETEMKRPSVSMLLSGTYPAQSLDLATSKHGSRILKLYRDQVLCPYQHRGLAIAQCRALAAAPMSTSDPDQISQWRACRQCALNPHKPEKGQ